MTGRPELGLLMRGQSGARVTDEGSVRSLVLRKYAPSVTDRGLSGGAGCRRGGSVRSRGAMVVVDKENAAKKQKGSKSLPKGVIETGRKAIKYQARVSYRPDGSKTVQRNAGTFDTPEEAALQIAACEAKLAEGMDPWDGAEIRSQHKRGQVWRSILMLRCSRIPVRLIQGSTLAGTANED